VNPKTPLLDELDIAPMAPADIEEILAIEHQAFSNPWTRRAFLGALGPDSYALVARYEGQVAGYGIAWIRPRELHIVNLAVHKDLRRKGIASALIQRLLRVARQKSLQRAVLEVRISNAPAAALYESHGFERIALDRGYYLNPPEDAVVMMKDLRDDNGKGEPGRKLSDRRISRSGPFWHRPWLWFRRLR